MQEFNIESAVIILLQLHSCSDCKGPLMLIMCDGLWYVLADTVSVSMLLLHY